MQCHEPFSEEKKREKGSIASKCFGTEAYRVHSVSCSAPARPLLKYAHRVVIATHAVVWVIVRIGHVSVCQDENRRFLPGRDHGDVARPLPVGIGDAGHVDNAGDDDA